MNDVLVTGGTGFLGAHCICRLLQAGYDVRTTIRSASREGEVRAMLQQGGASAAEGRLSFYEADLTHDAGWSEAVRGCRYVLHVASPFPDRIPKNEDELIVPARDGALRVLRAARDARVERVVLTSSFAAIGYGHAPRAVPFTENDWTDLDNRPVAPYQKSKTIAERSAWDFVQREGRGLELAVINPVGIFGPVLGPNYATSILLIKRLLDGSIPGCIDIWFESVDVRDVVELHMEAMTHPAAAGQRFLASSSELLSMRDVALILRRGLGEAARKAPLRVLPKWLLRLIAVFDAQVRGILPEVGVRKGTVNDKARRMFGWKPRSAQEAILATAESLIALKLVR